jgi:hypothetical protein
MVSAVSSGSRDSGGNLRQHNQLQQKRRRRHRRQSYFQRLTASQRQRLLRLVFLALFIGVAVTATAYMIVHDSPSATE